MDVHFSSVSELKQRLMPAIRLRKKEMNQQNVFITEEEIWSYFVNHSWKYSVQLSLAQMVDDILNKEIAIEKDEIL